MLRSKPITYPTHNLLILMLVTMVFAMCSLWLLNNHYISDIAMFRWAKVLGVVDAEMIRMEHFRFIYPHAPFYMLVPFTLLPDGFQAAAPYFISSLTVAILFALWNHHMRHNARPMWQRAILLFLLIIQPTVLWAATSGGYTAISLLMFYLLYRSCLRMIYQEDVRSFIVLGLILALYFFADPIALFLFIALIPFISIIAPRRMLLDSPISVFLMIAMPLAIAVLSWTYLNWIFEGKALNFISDPDSSFLGGWQDTPTSEWLRHYGGRWFAPLIAAFIQLSLFFPVVFLLLPLSARYGKHLKASIILLLHPVIAIAFASSKYFLFHPLEILTLISAGIMAELTIIPLTRRWKFPLLIIFLVIGALSGWHRFSLYEEPEIKHWYQALTQQLNSDIYQSDAVLGEWLSLNNSETLIDERSAYRAIVARGNARQLYLPISDQFKIQTRFRQPNIDLIVVPDPATKKGGRDRVNLRYPDLYNNGMPGYQRVYDHEGWRVFQSEKLLGSHYAH